MSQPLSIYLVYLVAAVTGHAPPSSPGSTYCNQNHDGTTNPCRSPFGTDYCCDCQCTYCGPQEYCLEERVWRVQSGGGWRLLRKLLS